jgi:hypothetical protein
MLTEIQRAKLKAASRIKRGYKRGDIDFSNDNKDLDIAIAEIRNENPAAFWTQETLILRRFLIKPKFPIPYRSPAAPGRGEK